MATEAECLAALRAAARELGESPTKAAYEELGMTPAASTILRVCGGWNEAKDAAGLETVTQAEAGGGSVQPKPEGVEIPDGAEWEALTPQQRWYYKNREHRIKCKESRRKRLRNWLTEFKTEHCRCEICGESRAPCLDFHHPSEKDGGVSSMANDGYSKERIRAEIADCRVLCANCHRKEHDRPASDDGDEDASRGQRPRRKWLTALKRESGGCRNCEESSPACLDYHHTGPKSSGIGEMVSRRYPQTRIREELDQCELLCANCHRIEHHG